ncbi:hypothetical protein [Novosphingobium sp.]|uniref:hypothetical protein n=1 Tax=Novosphingobium sp. TaxID=1874826 RepID=UPI0038B8D2C4
MGYQITPDDTETAKVMASGGFGAMVLVYLRHPGTLIRAVAMIAVGIGIASIFSATVASITGFGKVQVAAVLGMVGLVIARRIIEWIEGLDITALLPWKKGT